MAESAQSAEEKAAREMERRRLAEKERRERILDVRQRTLGVDTAALDAQVREKAERDAAERARAAAFDREQAAVQQRLAAMAREQERARREADRDVDAFRAREEGPQKPQQHMRYVASLAPQMDAAGASSGLVFEGEDADRRERERRQQQQQREWAAQQQRQREERAATQRELDMLHDQRALDVTERAKELERLQQQTRRAMAMEVREQNRALAEAKAQGEKDALIAETLASLESLSAIAHSDLLVEDPAKAASRADPSRVVPDRFKGMSPAQIRAIQEQQREQVAAKEEERRREREQNRRWEQQEIAVMRAALLREREIERQRREVARSMLEENAQDAATQTQRKAQTAETFANRVTDGFFDQFGTTSR